MSVLASHASASVFHANWDSTLGDCSMGNRTSARSSFPQYLLRSADTVDASGTSLTIGTVVTSLGEGGTTP